MTCYCFRSCCLVSKKLHIEQGLSHEFAFDKKVFKTLNEFLNMLKTFEVRMSSTANAKFGTFLIVAKLFYVMAEVETVN